MRKLLAVGFISLILFSCTDKKKEEKDLFNEVIKIHDQVMGKEELIMINKMQLDTLMKTKANADITEKANKLQGALDNADTAMENWMHNFDAENKGKSHEEIMSYLTDQKKQIQTLDNNFNATIAEANKFIKQYKSK